MWQLSNSWPNQFQNNLTWPSNTARISLDSRLEYSKITHRYAKVSPFTWFLCWKLPIDTDFIHFICHFHQAVTYVLMGQLHLSKACWELWLSDDQSHWCAILIAHQIVMAKHGGSCVHFSGISTCGRTSRETVSHPQRQPLPTPYKIFLYPSMLLWQIHGCNR